jgi:hypothetical protein
MGKTLCVLVALLWSGTAHARTHKCRALDANDGALILEVENRSATKCTALLTAAMKKRRCEHAPKGKQFEFTTHYDHSGAHGKLVTLSCGEVSLPKCRAIDLKTKRTIAEVAQASSARCAKLLATEVKKERCTKSRSGKRIAYASKFEQRGAKDKRVALVCK